jgi:anti-sigma factor RsiW
MVLNCAHVWEYISEYIDDTLDATIREEVQRHLESCEICSAVLDSMHNILILTADDRVFELPVGYSTRLHSRIDDFLKQQPQEPSDSG